MPYTVKFPDSDNIIHFKNLGEICSNLKVNEYTINSIIDGTCKFSRENVKALSGIVITRISLEPPTVTKAREEAKMQKKLEKEQIQNAKIEARKQELMLSLNTPK
jgi:hypothetical protein